MRIVHVAPFYHPVIGGVEEVVKRIAEYMTSRGNEVYVVTYNRLRRGGIGSLPRKEVINDVEVRRIRPDFIWSYGTYSSELPEVIEELRPDIVHVHVWRHPHVFQIAKLKERMGFKAILHTHAPFYKMSQLGVLTWLYHKTVDCFMRGTLRKYDKIIALTPYEKKILMENLGVEEEKIVVIPNGVDDKLFSLPKCEADTNSIILYIGRISRSKNITLLVKAMKHVRSDLSIKLVLAGPDEGLITKLKSYAQRHGINLHYLGLVSEEEKHKLYCECTVFANPSIYEGFGITLLEAQSLGKPCVITGDGGQIYAAPPGRTSLYVKPNPKSFGEAISLLLSDKTLYKRLSANAREWAKQHLWSRILPIYDKIYSSL